MVSVCFHGRQKQLVSLVKLPTVLSAPVCFIYSQWSAHTKVSSGSTASPRFVSWFHKKNKPCSRIPPPPFLFFEASLDNFDTLQLQRESFPKVMVIYLQRVLDIKVPHISVHHTDYKKNTFLDADCCKETSPSLAVCRSVLCHSNCCSSHCRLRW